MDKTGTDIGAAIASLQQAVNRLREAVTAAESPIKSDAVIQRFEFTFELAWKALKRILAYEGVICKTPRESLRQSFRLGLLAEEEIWLNMLEDRNAMSHIYSEEAAKEIYQRVPQFMSSLEGLLLTLTERYGNESREKAVDTKD